MGLCHSVDDDQNSKKAKNEQVSFPKKQVDREMLVQTQKKDEEIRRKPGDIGGNQFCVDELENCKVIVNDICDSMTIDRCTNCELILSAVRGSVFIRDCVDSKFQIVCGQFRCRSCTNCDFFIHVRSGPVVESSKNIRIGCSTLFYPELIDQMNQLKLDPLLNCWTDIHDFTPDEGNFSYVSGQINQLDIMDTSGKCLPFTHKKGETSGMSVFTAKIPENQYQQLIEMSYKAEIHLLDVKKEGNDLICKFESSSQDELSDQIGTLSPIFID